MPQPILLILQVLFSGAEEATSALRGKHGTSAPVTNPAAAQAHVAAYEEMTLAARAVSHGRRLPEW